MAKQPKIRFKGFTEEWKEAPLGQLVKEHRVSNQFVHHQNLLSLSYGKIVRRDIHANKGLLPASFDTYQIIDKDTIVFRVTDLQNDKRSLRVAISGEEGIISPAYVCVDVTSDEITASLLHKILHYHDVITKIYYKMGDGMRQTLNFHDLQELKLNYPNNEKEQKAIADIFNSIDATVTSKEAELEKLKNIKRALLEKLFPQDGQSIPAIRFKEFVDKWEPKSLGEVADKVITKNLSCSINETFTNSAEYGIMSQRDFFDHSISNSNNISGYYVVQQDDFVYNPRISKNAPVGPINRNKLGRSGVVSPLYTVFRPNGQLDLDYLEVFFWQYSWNKFMKFNGNSGARLDRFSISDEVFWQMPIQSPKTPEQKKVANTLLLLSKTISLRERQLTLLKHSKQALLEQMFVNN